MKKGKVLQENLGENSSFVRCDFTVPDEIEKFIIHGKNTFGHIDVAIHCSYQDLHSGVPPLKK